MNLLFYVPMKNSQLSSKNSATVMDTVIITEIGQMDVAQGERG